MQITQIALAECFSTPCGIVLRWNAGFDGQHRASSAFGTGPQEVGTEKKEVVRKAKQLEVPRKLRKGLLIEKKVRKQG